MGIAYKSSYFENVISKILFHGVKYIIKYIFFILLKRLFILYSTSNLLLK